jgi:SAM-dependent methyltransferase
MIDVLNHRPNILLENFLEDYQKFNKIDYEYAKQLISLGFKLQANAPYQKFLVDEWYASLEADKPNFDLYDHQYYFVDLWICWKEYSRNYLKAIPKRNSLDAETSIYSYLKDIRTVADLGCGLGLTSAGLKQIFKNARVVGTNIKDTKQYAFCEFMSKKYDFEIEPHYSRLPKLDLLFASEYYEHIYDCLDEIDVILKTKAPRYLYIASSFNTVSYGHFRKYKTLNSDAQVDQKKISKIFNNTLKLNGYRKIKTKLWNNRPALWSNFDYIASDISAC